MLLKVSSVCFLKSFLFVSLTSGSVSPSFYILILLFKNYGLDPKALQLKNPSRRFNQEISTGERPLSVICFSYPLYFGTVHQ